MRIKIFITGGTFDKEYDERTGALFFKKTHVSGMLRRGRCDIPVDIQTLMMIDSLEMTDQDRATIATRCLETEENHIVITHGTDTMEITAKYLSERQIGKTIVLTGAMIPYAFGSSDGFYNLGSALAFVQTLPPGVYVAMNGKYFNANNVHKNKAKGIFEPVR